MYFNQILTQKILVTVKYLQIHMSVCVCVHVNNIRSGINYLFYKGNENNHKIIGII